MNLKKVIIPAITCPSVLNAVLYANARPIFVDVDKETHNLDPEKLTSEIIEQSDGLIITNTYGHPAKIDEIRELCDSNNIMLIEDFAQSNGAWYKNKRCGSFGDISVVSFYGPKTMTTGQGGMILTDSKEFHHLTKIARGDNTYEYIDSVIPLNFKMTDFQAALGLNQLTKLDEFVRKRRMIAETYNESLRNINSITIPVENEKNIHCYYKYMIQFKNNNRNIFIEIMKRNGISIGKLYDPPLHKMKIVKELLNMDITLANSEAISKSTVSLPIYTEMNELEINQVVSSIAEIIKYEIY